MKGVKRAEGKGAFDLIEEATHLFRTLPAATLAIYYAGAIPFILGLLYFWTDMSRSPFASQHLGESALGVSALFLWMKFWQSIYTFRLRAQITGEAMPKLNLAQSINIFSTQLIIQPSGLFLLPVAAILSFPYAWVYAFYQNATVLAGRAEGNATKLFKMSWTQAALWPRQNHVMLAIVLAFAFCVFLNWCTVWYLLPQLFKTLFGVESVFSKSPIALLNSTFFAGVCGLTYLCMDPLLKAVYVLRCFYGEARESGEDLKAELKPFSRSTQLLAALLFLLMTCLCAPAAEKESPAAATPSSQTAPILPGDLDRSIHQTIHEQKYAWRMPRDKIVEGDANPSVIALFFEQLGDICRKCIKAVFNWIEQLLRKLFPLRANEGDAGRSSGYGWMVMVELLLYVLLALALSGLGLYIYRAWRGRRKLIVAPSEIILPTPDLADENVHADQLPEDGWTKLARELLERGEFRLAMRAFYLASLAHLATRSLISIARFKSNRDYEIELRRRAHALPQMVPLFCENVFTFERIWYGLHEVNSDLVRQFAENVDKMKATG